MRAIFKKTITITLLVAIFAPQFVLAQQATTNNQNTLQPIQVNNNSQAASALNGTSGSGFSAGGAVGAAGKATGTCLGTNVIANAAKSYISGLVDSVTSPEVPVAPTDLNAKEVSSFGSLGPSWDQVGYCFVNAIIEYIGRSTVAWINGGFQGNPVFVDDPTQFFSDVADIEAGQFLAELSNGALCGPIQNVVRVNLANSYNNRISPYGRANQCTFSGISGNIEQFTSGQSFSWGDFISYTQNPQNNSFGATYLAQVELDQRIASSIGTQSRLLDWGKGFLSFTDPETKKIVSPGSVIESQVNQRLFNGDDRIKLADEFDEVVNALVNSLIRVALNEVTKQGN